MSRRALLAILLLSVVLALPPIAHAAPTDPVWISGLYDDNDYDDVVLFIIGAVGAIDSGVVNPVGLDVIDVGHITDLMITRLDSSHVRISYTPFCLDKKDV